jgi:hypothetical protein
MPRARTLALACSGIVLGALAAQLGCSANCLRNTDCDDAHVCRHNACVLPPQPVSDAGFSENAGASGTGASGASGLPGAAGSNALGAGGSAGADSESAGAGGSSTLPRDNLDAATDADAADAAF